VECDKQFGPCRARGNEARFGAFPDMGFQVPIEGYKFDVNSEEIRALLQAEVEILENIRRTMATNHIPPGTPYDSRVEDGKLILNFDFEAPNLFVPDKTGMELRREMMEQLKAEPDPE
jgi:hypothetical protein